MRDEDVILHVGLTPDEVFALRELAPLESESNVHRNIRAALDEALTITEEACYANEALFVFTMAMVADALTPYGPNAPGLDLDKRTAVIAEQQAHTYAEIVCGDGVGLELAEHAVAMYNYAADDVGERRLSIYAGR